MGHENPDLGTRRKEKGRDMEKTKEKLKSLGGASWRYGRGGGIWAQVGSYHLLIGGPDQIRSAWGGEGQSPKKGERISRSKLKI